MSRAKDVYEDLQEYVKVINSRRREIEEDATLSEVTIYAITTTLETVEEELERILDGKGL